jgi:hypothetical protein
LDVVIGGINPGSFESVFKRAALLKKAIYFVNLHSRIILVYSYS